MASTNINEFMVTDTSTIHTRVNNIIRVGENKINGCMIAI